MKLCSEEVRLHDHNGSSGCNYNEVSAAGVEEQ